MDGYTTTLCVREIFTLEKRVFHIKMKSFRAETVRQFSCRCVQWRGLQVPVRAVCCRCVVAIPYTYTQ